MYKIPKKIINALENADFNLSIGSDYLELRKFSSLGQDFGFTISLGKDSDEFYENLEKYYQDFNPSEEAAMYINCDAAFGAPKDLQDLLDDAKECEEFIREACKIVSTILYGYSKVGGPIKEKIADAYGVTKAIAYYVDKQFGPQKASDPSWYIPTLADFITKYLNHDLSDEEAEALSKYKLPDWDCLEEDEDEEDCKPEEGIDSLTKEDFNTDDEELFKCIKASMRDMGIETREQALDYHEAESEEAMFNWLYRELKDPWKIKESPLPSQMGNIAHHKGHWYFWYI